MANIEELNDNVLEEAAGGKSGGNVNKHDWAGAHWQPDEYKMGTTFTAHGYNWYRIKPGDSLSAIAQRYGYTVKTLMDWNPKTIKNANLIYAGDAIVLGKGHL